MDFIDRRWFIPGLVLIVGLVLLGRWAMHADSQVNAPRHSERPASFDSTPAKTRLPTIAEATSKTAPSTVSTASAFGTLRGQVIDAVTRKPVREFEVRFYGTEVTEATNESDEGPDTRTFQTVDGRFEWKYLPSGDWTLTVSADGYQRFWLIDLHIPRGDATPEITLPLRPGHKLRGRVYDEASGAGIASATVGFRESDTGTRRFEGRWGTVYVTSANDGTFVLGGLPPGHVTLRIYARGYAGRELEVIVGKEPSPLEIALSAGGTITGRLTAADGITPVTGTVGLAPLDRDTAYVRETGEAGEFSFQHLAAGRYRLSGLAEGGRVTRELMLASNQRIEGLVLALSAGHSIRGVVTGLRPEDLKEVSVWVYPSAAYADVDDGGAYALHGVQPGRVQVVAEVTMRRQLSKTVEMPADSNITVNFYFPTGARLSGRVTRGEKPLAGVWLTPRPAVEQDIEVRGARTSKEGEYVIEDLPAGEYEVLVSGYKGGQVRISGDTVFNIDMPLAQLSGRVLEEGGEVPVVGADVVIWPAEPSSSQIRLHDRSDHFGQFTLAGLEPGDFMLAAYKPGYGMFRKRISYDSPVGDMTIRLRQELGVEIKVREAGSGKPLQWIQAIEMIGGHHGSRLQLQLDDEGKGYLPSALAGSTLSFSASGYAPAVIPAWSGQRLNLQLERQEAQ